MADPCDLYYGSQLLLNGQVVAVDNDPVWAMWADGNNPSAVDAMYAIKGRNVQQKFGMTLDSNHFVAFVDPSCLAPDARKLIEEPELMTQLLAPFFFIQAPGSPDAIEEYGLPDCVVSQRSTTGGQKQPMLQNYDPVGKDDITALLTFAHMNAIQNTEYEGNHFLPIVTSLNKSGMGELTDSEHAVEFARENNLPVMFDPFAKQKCTGSYPILRLDEQGITLVRQGNLHFATILKLLDGFELNVAPTILKPKDGTIQYEAPDDKSMLTGKDLHDFMLADMGWEKIQIPYQRR